MNDKKMESASAGMGLGDIYFILFRHKRKILILGLLGIIGAVTYFFLKPPPFQSQAKLLIKYVQNLPSINMAPGAPANSKQGGPQLADDRGASIINTEIQILTSLKVAESAVETVKPERILAKLGGGNDANKAAFWVQRNLIVEVPRGSCVLEVTMPHPDPELAKALLTEIVRNYLLESAKAHQASEYSDEELHRKVDVMKDTLKTAEEELRKAKVILGPAFETVSEARKDAADRMSHIQSELLIAKTKLADYQSLLKPESNSNAAPALPMPEAQTNTAAAEIPAEVQSEYRSLLASLDAQRKRESELGTQFLPKSTMMQAVVGQIQRFDARRVEIEAQYPKVVDIVKPVLKNSSPAALAAAVNPVADAAVQVASLNSRITFLNSELDEIRTNLITISAAEPKITELELHRAQNAQAYETFNNLLERTSFENSIVGNKISNISEIQAPSPAFRDRSKSIKVAAGLTFSGLFIALAWAFVYELIFDRSIRKPKEVETKLNMRLFISVPETKQNGKPRKGLKALPAPNGSSATATQETAAANGHASGKHEVALWDHSHKLRPYFEALRDRLVGYFEVRNLTHKPKLVAVTSAGKRSGITTMAVGLAASLSETGDGNVLLVDMNLEHGAAQQFFKGKPTCGIDDALVNEKREPAMVQDNLYVVSGGSQGPNGDKLPRILPKRFANLLPKLKASDYDYIIFDMPPISQTSVTARLAGFMDMVLFVVHAEKTNQESAQRAGALLAESKANVSVVLNRTHDYVPERLSDGLLNDV